MGVVVLTYPNALQPFETYLMSNTICKFCISKCFLKLILNQLCNKTELLLITTVNRQAEVSECLSSVGVPFGFQFSLLIMKLSSVILMRI